MGSPLRNILILTADKSAGVPVKKALRDHGYNGIVVGTLPLALEAAELLNPLVLILDRRLVPVKQARYAIALSKVLCLSVDPRGMGCSDDECAQDLDDGADAYMCGTTPRQIVALVRALVRRSRLSMRRTSTIGSVQMDFDNYEVRVSGRPVHLTRKQYQILELLFLHPARMVRKEELISKIWGEHTALDEHTLTVHIHAIRKKIESDAKRPRLLQTVQGIGYRLVQ